MVCKTTATNIFILAKKLFRNSCPCCLGKLKTICLYIIDAVRDHTDFSSVQSLPLIINICLFYFISELCVVDYLYSYDCGCHKNSLYIYELKSRWRSQVTHTNFYAAHMLRLASFAFPKLLM